MNEIATSEQGHAFRGLQRIFNEFDDVCVVLSSRKYGFKQRFGLPVFELLPLSDEMILDYLERNMPFPNEGRKLFDELTSSKSLLLDFARNPLMLRMLAQVARGGELPANRGQLFRLFTNWIFSRERKRKQTATSLKEKALAAVAFGMRVDGKTYAPQALVLRWLKESLAQWHAKVDVSDLFCELLDNHILELDANRRVTFFHELVLEYFAALELQRLYLIDKELIARFYNRVKWFEPIIMLSGLLASPLNAL